MRIGGICQRRLEWMRRAQRFRERNEWRFWRIEQLSMELWFALRAKDYKESDRARKLLNAYGMEVSQYKDKLPWDAPVNIVVGREIDAQEYFDGMYEMTISEISKVIWDSDSPVKWQKYPTPTWSKDRFWPKHHPSFVPTFGEVNFEMPTDGWRKMAAEVRRTHATNAEWWARHYEAVANAIERDLSYMPEPDSEWLLGGA